MQIEIFDNDIEKFIKSLEKPVIAKVLRSIELLEYFGSELTMPHSRKIFRDVFELRIRGAQEIRILYIFYKNKIILLNGFIKKKNKIPKREIKKALDKSKRLE